MNSYRPLRMLLPVLLACLALLLYPHRLAAVRLLPGDHHRRAGHHR